ncbi:MAG: branched-chain amino acid ABC transporter permease [Burkholderiales bacterium]|jgi:branched-chain amino acid transport system permease protein|nr:branched-chain amino acid ABC transporter permease [Burkholderiales bacterium]
MRSTVWLDIVIAAAAMAVLLLLPLVFPGKAFSDFMIRLSAFAIFATSLNLLVGYTGLVSFGHGLFYGLGAYSFALMMQKLGTSIPVAFIATVGVSAAVATVVGAICIRLKEIYFSFLTLAFQMLLHSVIIAWTPLTGGDQGLTGGVPRPPFLGIRLDDPQHLYIFCSAVLVVSLYIMWHLVRSPFGYTMRMIRDNPRRAEFLGVRVWRVRLLAFVVAGVFGSIGGLLMSLFVSSAYPDFAYWTVSGEAVFMILMGGISVFFGPLVGAVMLLLLNDVVTRVTEHYSLMLGIIILCFALGLRKGLLGFVLWAWERRRAGAQ